MFANCNNQLSYLTHSETGFTGMVRELFQEGRSQTLHGHAFFQDIGRSDPSMESWAHTVDG